MVLIFSGHEAHKGQYHHDIVSEPPHHHHLHHHHDGWVTPYEHDYGHGSGPWDNSEDHDVWGKWRHHDWEHSLD